MRKICIGILAMICGIVLVVNFAFPDYYVPIEWNFQYGQSYLKYFVQSVNSSSELINLCVADDDCKILLEQYNFNSTVIDY